MHLGQEKNEKHILTQNYIKASFTIWNHHSHGDKLVLRMKSTGAFPYISKIPSGANILENWKSDRVNTTKDYFQSLCETPFVQKLLGAGLVSHPPNKQRAFIMTSSISG